MTTGAEYLRAIRAAAVARGLCLECSSRPVRCPGSRRCETCAERQRRRRAAIIAAGGCRQLCGREALPRKRRCQTCLDRHRDYMRARRGAAPKPPRIPAAAPAPVMPRIRRKAAVAQLPTPVIPPAERLRLIAERARRAS